LACADSASKIWPVGIARAQTCAPGFDPNTFAPLISCALAGVSAGGIGNYGALLLLKMSAAAFQAPSIFFHTTIYLPSSANGPVSLSKAKV